MTILGADPDQLEATASRLLTHADGYENACNHIGHWLRRMDWQGPEADRFRSNFESQTRPQLDVTAAFLRQAASELRAQAASQTKVSQTLDVAGSAWAAVMAGRELSDALKSLFADSVFSEIEDVTSRWGPWLDIFLPVPIGGPIGFPPPSISSINDVVNMIGMGTDFLGFADLAYLRYLNKLPDVGDKLGPFGVSRHVGTTAGRVLGGASGIVGLLNLPGDIGEIHGVLEKMGESKYIQPEDMGDLLDAVADTILDTAAIVGTKFPRAGLMIGAFGGGLKVGAQLEAPVTWLVDNVIYPACPEVWNAIFDVSDAVVDFGGDVLGAGVDFGGDVLDAGVDFGGDVLAAGVNRIEDLWPF